MKRHPVTGENICRPLKSLRLVLPIIRSHHEHFNGSGYPDALHGRDIPMLARILQVVDVYDALRTARPYKPALSHDQAAITMRDEARAGLWDEELVLNSSPCWKATASGLTVKPRLAAQSISTPARSLPEFPQRMIPF